MLSPDTLEIYYKRFGRYPDSYYAEPILSPQEAVLLDVFQELETTVRYAGGRIPLDSIYLFSQIYNIDFRKFRFIIREIEKAVLKLRDKNDGR